MIKSKKAPTTKKGPILIGRGELGWSRTERVSDRYGSVTLYTPGTEAVADMWIPPSRLGTISATVIDSKRSHHIGDFFRGLRQIKPPEVGQVEILGTGRAFSQVSDGVLAIGVKPADGRSSDWLDPKALYRIHGSTVELHWRPK